MIVTVCVKFFKSAFLEPSWKHVEARQQWFCCIHPSKIKLPTHARNQHFMKAVCVR